MKYFFLLCFSICLFACNGKDEETDLKKSAQPISQENVLKNAVKNHPDSLLLLQNLVEYYAAGQNFDAALASINNALSKDSSNPVLWDMQSTIAAEKGDTAQAIKALQNAIDIYPIPEYIIALGALYAETKNPMALQLADALLAGNKAKAEKEAYFIKGLYYSFNNEKEKSIPFFDKCIAINYSFMDAYLEKALALYELKKYKEAAEILEKAVTLQNKFVRGYYYLGQCYEKLNRIEDAKEVYQTGLVYDDKDMDLLDALGRLGVK